jgi:hypothetical protein
MISPPFDFTRYKTQGKGHGFVEVFARRLKTDRVLRQRVMVAKIKELANLAREPEDDPEVQWAHVQEVRGRRRARPPASRARSSTTSDAPPSATWTGPA